MKLVIVMCAVFFGLFSAPRADATMISFSGDFAPPNWTLTTDGGAGSVNTANVPWSITLFGSNSPNSGWDVNTVYAITVPTSTSLDFFWSYQTFDRDGPGFDPAGFSVNGVLTPLSDNFGATIQSGTVSGLSLAAGDTFAFYVDSIDNWLGPAQLTVTSVPEPATLPLLAAGLGLIALLRRRR